MYQEGIPKEFRQTTCNQAFTNEYAHRDFNRNDKENL